VWQVRFLRATVTDLEADRNIHLARINQLELQAAAAAKRPSLDPNQDEWKEPTATATTTATTTTTTATARNHRPPPQVEEIIKLPPSLNEQAAAVRAAEGKGYREWHGGVPSGRAAGERSGGTFRARMRGVEREMRHQVGWPGTLSPPPLPPPSTPPPSAPSVLPLAALGLGLSSSRSLECDPPPPPHSHAWRDTALLPCLIYAFGGGCLAHADGEICRHVDIPHVAPPPRPGAAWRRRRPWLI